MCHTSSQNGGRRKMGKTILKRRLNNLQIMDTTAADTYDSTADVYLQLTL